MLRALKIEKFLYKSKFSNRMQRAIGHEAPQDYHWRGLLGFGL